MPEKKIADRLREAVRRRGVSLALDPRRRARPAAGPLDDGKPGLSGA